MLLQLAGANTLLWTGHLSSDRTLLRIVGLCLCRASFALLCQPTRLPATMQVCWHEGSVGDLADSLRRFAPRGSTVTIISKEEPEVNLSLL